MGQEVRKIAVFTGNRAEYGLLHPVIRELVSSPNLEISLIVSGSHLSEVFGKTNSEIDESGLAKVFFIDLGSNIDRSRIDVSGAFAAIIKESAPLLGEIKPQVVLLAGDRYETFAMAVTAFYNNFPIAHLFGGDLSQGGHLDDSVRHSISKLAHLHFTTNPDSYNRVLHLGEEKWRVFNVGSPAVDNVLSGDYAGAKEVAAELQLDLQQPFILFTQHPVTTESDSAYQQVKESLEALKELGYQTVITYPCNDPGSEAIIRAINEYAGNEKFRIRKSLGWRLYLGCLRLASVVVGNSSSGLTETPLFQVPCVNIGSRQRGRLRGENVIDVSYDRHLIEQAIKEAITNQDFRMRVSKSENPYGTGGASKMISEILKTITFNQLLLQKKMTF